LGVTMEETEESRTSTKMILTDFTLTLSEACTNLDKEGKPALCCLELK